MTNSSRNDSENPQQPESNTSTTLTPDTQVRTKGSGPHSTHGAQEEEIMKDPSPRDQSEDINSTSVSVTRVDENEELVITNIRANGVALRPGQIPVGFYIALHHSGLEWRTETKHASADIDVVEWDRPIPIPSDLSATIELGIYAVYEVQPALGDSEQLRKLSVNVETLLASSTLVFPKDADIISPRLSLSVIITKKNGQGCVLWGPNLRSSTRDARRELDNSAAGQDRSIPRHGKHWDLKRSILQFLIPLDPCRSDHPYLTVAQPNLTTTKYTQHSEIDTTDSFLFVTLHCGNCLFAHFRRLEEITNLEQAISRIAADVDLTSDDHPGKPALLSNLSDCFLARYERFGELADLEHAISRIHSAVNLTSDDHPDKSALLNNLSNCFRVRFELLGELYDLEQAISRLNNAVNLTPNGHPHKPICLCNLGVCFKARFERLGELADLEHVISRIDKSVDLISDEHPSKPFWLSSLGNSFKSRFQRLRVLADLEEAISKISNAADLISNGHPYKPSFLSEISNCFFIRFEQLGGLADLEKSISKMGTAVDLTPGGHTQKSGYLNVLGIRFKARFDRLGELVDLEQAISSIDIALNLTPGDHPQRPGLLSNLGNCFRNRFQFLGDVADLELAISRIGEAVDLVSNDYPYKPIYLGNLSNAFKARFDRFGEITDLEQAISTINDAVNLTPITHPHKPIHLGDLGNYFFARFSRSGELADLERAISSLANAVSLAPNSHPHKPRCLSNLGNCLRARFERLGKLADAEQAISLIGFVVYLTPDDHPQKPGYLSSLSNTFFARFQRLGELGDLQQAILKMGTAVELTPNGHPDKPDHLGDLGYFFLTRFDRLEEFSDLERAISRIGDAVDLTPSGHPRTPACLCKLGICLKARFHRLGELSDLERAISRIGDAVNITPNDHPHKPIYLSNLGNFLFSRFERLGELADLEQAILRVGDAIDLTPDDHPEKCCLLSILGKSFRARFDRLRELADIERAISRTSNAVDLTPHDHPHKPSHLNSLGNCLFARFGRLGEIVDLDKAISTMGDAVELSPDSHPDKPIYMNNLGSCFTIRFERLGVLADLEQGISMIGNAVDLTPHGHPGKPGRLNSLSKSYMDRFDRLGELVDLEGAISSGKDAVDLTPDGHRLKPVCLSNLGNSLRARFQRVGELADLEQAMSTYSSATCASAGDPVVRIRASKQWALCARQLGHHTILDAYSSAISLLPQLAWIGITITHRYRELLAESIVVREGAAAALDSGVLETAVEWLEEGRSVVWSGLSELRNSYEDLESVHPIHACKLRELSAALDRAGAAREKTYSPLLELASDTIEFSSFLQKPAHKAKYTTETLEQEANKHRRLAIERDQLLQEIRGLPGFERFLLHKEFSRLRAAAHSGPVVILNAAENHCDALIILVDADDVIHIPLPNFTLKRLEVLQTSLRSIVHAREGKRVRVDYTTNWKSMLSTLWKSVVRPVLDALAFSTPSDNPSRIFWCPTGPFTFLPIHAAGLYDEEHSEPGHKLSDFVVSSYIPTLSILLPSSDVDPAPTSKHLRLLAVRQPPSDGLSPLPGVDEELGYIKEIVQNSPSAPTLEESADGSVEEVMELMKEADWVHFACHGVQDDESPSLSGLCLADGRRLKLLDIVGLSRPRGGLAFLSACETAMGDKGLSDEAVHIAAGMLFAGFEGVVATMWPISDRLAPLVARDVYEQLFRNETRADPSKAARALQDAVGRLRAGGASFQEWIPFIHVGL